MYQMGRRTDQLHEEIEDGRAKVGELTKKMNEVLAEQNQTLEATMAFKKTLATLERKKQEVTDKERHLNELSEHMKLLTDSDKDLYAKQEQYYQRLEGYMQHIESRRTDHGSTVGMQKRVREQLGAVQTDQGRFQAEKKTYEDALRERLDIVRQISVKHDLRGFDGELSDSLVQEFISKVARMSKDQNLVLKKIKSENSDRIAASQAVLNSLLNKKTSLEQKKESAQAVIKDSDREVRKLERELESLKASGAGVDMAKEDLGKKEMRLKEAKNQAQTAELEGSLLRQNAELRDLEEKVGSVTEELYQGTRNAESRAQLTILKQNIDTRRKALAALLVFRVPPPAGLPLC